jgi:hypothetical protein
MNDDEPFIIAIDPGANGAVVAARLSQIRRKPSGPVESHKIPETLLGLYDLLHALRNQAQHDSLNPVAFLEHNTGFMAGIKRKTSDGGEEAGGVSPKAMYSFGRNTGHLEMALVALNIPICRVTPIKWQNAAGVTTGRKKLMSPAQWKNLLKEAAAARFPTTKVTLANADALLILDAAANRGMRHVPNFF